jgi:predicted transposase YdaD
MFDYDATLKSLLKAPATTTLREISGLTIKRWMNVEFSSVEQRRLDLLGESNERCLLHLELQSGNDTSMAWRMMEYGAKVALRYKRFPKQVVLYVGKRPLRMTGDYYANGDLVFRYKVVDIRELDGKKLLDSAGIEANILAILARLGDKREAVRQIVGRTAKLDASARRSKLEQLSILAGLRKLEPLVKEEASRMPITEDILNHQIIGPAYRQGRQEGRQEGQQEGELELLRRQIVKRFGPIPAWLDERLARCSASDLLDLGERLLDAQSLEDILK